MATSPDRSMAHAAASGDSNGEHGVRPDEAVLLGVELARFSHVVGKEGQLSQRVVLRGCGQAWFQSIESVNNLIEDLARAEAGA